MSSTYTPGPWQWVDSNTDDPYLFGEQNIGMPSLRTVKEYGENKTDIIDGKHYTRFALPKFIVDAEYVENPADAALIAAAPDLLEALQDLMEYAAIIEERCDAVATNKARAAIAKATANDDEGVQ